ncbi:MAG: sugar phosphate isomerase/epimerase family protein [Candidatus Woesearchaeota archaeon]
MQIGRMNNPYLDVYKEIEWIGKKGFDFVDLTLEPADSLPHMVNPSRIRRIIRKYKLGVVGHMGDWKFPKDSFFPELREASTKAIINTMRALAKCGAKKITTHSFKCTEAEYKDAKKYLFDMYRELLAEAKKLGVELMVENGGTCFYNPINRRLYADLMNKYPKLKVHVDLGHANIGKNNWRIDYYLRKYKGRVSHLHFSDNYGVNDNHIKLGAGRISWVKVIKELKRYGYDSTITVETFRSGKQGELESKKKLRKWWDKY